MNFKKLLLICALTSPLLSWSAAPLDDSKLIFSVMELTAKNKSDRQELKKRMIEMREFQRKQPGYIDNAVLENGNDDNKPDFVGIARWKSLKDWETLWNNNEFKKLVARVTEMANVNPGFFKPVK